MAADLPVALFLVQPVLSSIPSYQLPGRFNKYTSQLVMPSQGDTRLFLPIATTVLIRTKTNKPVQCIKEAEAAYIIYFQKKA